MLPNMKNCERLEAFKQTKVFYDVAWRMCGRFTKIFGTLVWYQAVPNRPDLRELVSRTSIAESYAQMHGNNYPSVGLLIIGHA